MKHGIICPVKYLNQFATLSNFHLVLPHLFEKFPEYKSFYKERIIAGDIVIVDNDLFEKGECSDYKEVLKKAEDIGAQIVVGPEVMNDGEATENLMKDFLEWKDKVGSKIKVLAIAQGSKEEDLLCQFFRFQKMEGIDYLGLPFMLDYSFGGIRSLTLRRVLNRWKLIDRINLHAITYNIDIKPTHLFGLSDAVELQKYHSIIYPWIHSNDSSTAFVHGFNYIKYEDRGLPREKISEKLDFGLHLNYGLDTEIGKHQIECIMYNINKILNWCK
jgi:hypothetical protein